MERIASFCVDHTKLDRGMYLSRQDGDVLTWDIRMKKPNHGDYLSTGAAHTLEHLFATYARNSQYKDGVIYVGPMGCRTGFYLLTRGLTPAEALSPDGGVLPLHGCVSRAMSPAQARWSAATTATWTCPPQRLRLPPCCPCSRR